MDENQHKNRGSTKGLLFSFLAVLLLILPVLLFTVPDAQAAGTPAGTKIGNQATATYEDSSGNSFLSTSPLVETTVLPVRNLTITPNGADDTTTNTQNAAPGNFVYYSYTLTNLGNASDTFNINTAFGTNSFTPVTGSVKVYHDVLGNGIIDPGDTLLSTDTDGDGDGDTFTALGPIAADGSASLIVTYQVPSGATSGQRANVNVIGTSANDITKTDNNNFNKTTVTNNAVVTVTKSPSVTTIDPGGTITYTLTVSNNGNTNASSIVLTDNIPANSKLIVGSISSGLTTVDIKYYDDVDGGGSEVVAPPNGVNADIESFVITQTSGSLAPSNSRLITFQVQVDSTAPGGSSIDNFATYDYYNGAATISDTDTNLAQTTVNSKSAVLISYSASPFAETNVTGGDDEVGNTNAPDDYTETAANVPVNSYVYYKNVITNNGNTTDRFNITVDSSTLPSGSSVAFFQLTSATASANNSPLLDTNTDGIPDTGLLAAGDDITIVTRVFIPSNATTGGTAVILATSTNGGSALSANNGEKLTDTTRNVVTGIQAPGVDIRNIIDGSPSNTSVTFETSANGTTVSFPLNVLNTGGSSDTFNLSYSSNPSGSSVQFYMINTSTTVRTGATPTAGDTSIELTAATSAGIGVGDSIVINGQTLTIASVGASGAGPNGGTVFTFTSGQTLAFDAAAGDTVVEPSTTPITSTGSLAANASANVIAVVTIPAGTSPVLTPGDNIIFTATSNNDTNISDPITDFIIISEFRDFKLDIDRSGSAPSPGTLFYEHTITNTGNVDDMTFDLSFAGTANAQFTYQTLTTGGASITTTPPLDPGETYTFQVKVDIDGGVASNTTHIQIIRATDSSDNTNYRDNTDTTTVVAGFVTITKSVANITNPGLTATNEAYPGDILEYTITFTNIGTQNALNVKITDLIPAYSTYVDETMEINGVSKTDASGDDQAFSNESVLPYGVTFHVGTGADSANGGTVAPGASGTVSFRVMVNN